jgi:ubiquinone/menaquinone biosynthesis C-methylase UbiE
MNDQLPAYAIRLRALHDALKSDFRNIVRRLPEPRVKAIDVGCGDGFFTKLLAETQSEVIGIDNSDAYLREARNNNGNIGNIRFVNGDVSELPLDDRSVDIVWSAHSMHSYPDIKKALQEFRRVLRPGGLLAVLESDNIHSVLLSWPPDLELAVRQAEHREIGDEDSYIGTYFPRFAMQLFEEAGFTSFEREQYMITRFGPATKTLSNFVELYLKNLLERSAKFLSDKMCRRLESLADPGSPEFLPRRRNFAFGSLQSLMFGRASASVVDHHLQR